MVCACKIVNHPLIFNPSTHSSHNFPNHQINTHMKKYTLDNAIESVRYYISRIDKNGECSFKSSIKDCLNDQDIKDCLVLTIMTRFGADVLNYESSNAILPCVDDESFFESEIAIEQNWQDRLSSIDELERHSYYSNEIFCEYFQCAFPYITKNDRSLLDSDSK